MINNVTLLGNITNDPEIRTATSGKELCVFTIALNSKTPTGGKKTEYIDCVAWDKLGQTIAKYFRKGDYISIVGSLRTSKYKTPHGDWAKKYNVDISTFSFCGKGYDSAPAEQPAEDDPVVSLPSSDDDLPF